MERTEAANMLVVDDDPPSRKLLEGYLLSEGYRVRVAADGPAALSLARQHHPDVVLLDVMMPGMTGHEVCGILKREPQTRLCQVMMVTALGSTPDKVEGLDTGADDYLAKPVRRDEFLAKVRALLRARRLLVDLEQARHELAQRNDELQLKKTLAQTLVHDLKSPLAAILGNLDLIGMRGNSASLPLVERSRQGAKRMLKMILNLLDVEGLEEKRLVPAIDAVDLGELSRATIDELEVSGRPKRVAVRLRTDGAVFAQADALLMRRVIDNLLSNAIAHAPEDSTVVVHVAARPEGVELTVSDQGPGIPEDWREKVFDKYGQVEMRRSGTSSNRGLGLTFCRLAVEAHGGTIWVEEAEGGGACFRTLLPAVVDETERPRVGATAGS